MRTSSILLSADMDPGRDGQAGKAAGAEEAEEEEEEEEEAEEEEEEGEEGEEEGGGASPPMSPPRSAAAASFSRTCSFSLVSWASLSVRLAPPATPAAVVGAATVCSDTSATHAIMS